VVTGGVVYVGSSDGNLYAIDQRTGEIRWRGDVGSAVTSSPAVSDGVVIVGGRDGRWLAFNAATGAERWRITTGADLPFPWGYESGDRYTSSAVVAGAVAFLGSGDGLLRAVDVATGKVQWQARTAGRIRSSPAVSGSLVVVGDADGVVYAFDRTSGAARWKHETEGHTLRSGDFGYDRRTIQSSPAIVGNQVFVGARDGFLYALDLTTGTRRWRFDHKISWVNSSPAVDGGLVFAASSDGQFAQAVDVATGAEKWRVTTALVWASPSVSGNRVFVGDQLGRLHVLDKTTGVEKWSYRAGGPIFSSAAIAGGAVLFGSDDGAVYAVDATASTPMARAVYWDSSFARAATIPGHQVIRDWFRDRDYQVVDATELATFISHHLTDRAPSVVVLATDHLPSSIASPADSALLRRYLEAGGRVVDPGIAPLLWPRDVATGDRDLKDINRAAPARLLGVTFEGGNFDPNGTSSISPAGRRLGMSVGWMSTWAADPASVTEVLATDEMGLASAWVRRYGTKGQFIRIPAITPAPATVGNLLVLFAAAETWR
jgi:outer membrane protein assembly factor BamB